MATLPPSTDWTGSSVTEGGFKTAQSALRDFLAGLLGADGLQATALSTLGALLNGVSAKTGAYTLISTDRGKLIDATSGTWPLTLTAVATLGDGFAFAVKNSGTGVITIDPSGSETIDGAATITLAAGESCAVVCTGTGWKSVSKANALTSAAIVAALGYTPGQITLGTPVATTSGTYVDFTAIPAGVKRITVMFKGVSWATGVTALRIQIGDSGGIETTGYASPYFDGLNWNSSTNEFMLVGSDTSSGLPLTGSVTLNLENSSTNTWIESGTLGGSAGPFYSSVGSKSLSATLDRLRIGTLNNYAFDAGVVNISYE